MLKNSCFIGVFLMISFWSCKTAEPISVTAATSQKKTAIPTISSFTEGMDSDGGFFPFYWDEEKGKIYLEIDKLNSEFLYVNALAAGVGSNDLGLDRGQLGNDRIVYFEQHGPKILLIQPNYGFRAISDNQDEVKSVREAFASSVLWGFDVKAKSDWSVLIELTDFLLRDSHSISGRLTAMKQGR